MSREDDAKVWAEALLTKQRGSWRVGRPHAELDERLRPVLAAALELCDAITSASRSGHGDEYCPHLCSDCATRRGIAFAVAPYVRAFDKLKEGLGV